MKSCLSNIFKLAVFSIVLATLLSPASALAMDGSWSVDSNASDARFFLGSVESSNSVNIGVGRVTGMLNRNSNYPDDSSVDRSIYPADEVWAGVLDSRGGLPSDWRQGLSVSPIRSVDRVAQ